MFKVPLSTNVKDEVSDSLLVALDRCSDTTFTAAEAEVLDFLLAEVYPVFERTQLGNREGTMGEESA